jgi:hypothetical protein
LNTQNVQSVAGIPLPPNTVKDDDFTIVPNTGVFKEGPIGTREVHTQILDLNMTDGNMAVRAGNSAPDAARSIGEVESLNLPSGDFPAESFFDMFVEVDLPALPGPWNCIGGKTLINKRALVIQNGNLLDFPPEVVYVHGGATVAALVYDKATDQQIGWITLAGHGVDVDFPVVMAAVAAAGEVPPGCGPGPHWVDDCPEFSDTLPNTRLDVTIEKPCGTSPGTSYTLRGPTDIHKQAGTMIPWAPPPSIPSSAPSLGDHNIHTEIVSMVLTGGPLTLRAGVDQGLTQQSLGGIIELLDPLWAYSFFWVYHKIETPWGILHNNDPVLMEAIIDRVPPLWIPYRYLLEDPIPLYDADETEIACLLPPIIHRLPVTLDSFTATASNGAVALEWATGIEKDNAGFFVWRGQSVNGQCSNDPKNYKDVQAITPLVNSKGTEVSGATYTMKDSNVVSGNTYCYALEDRDFAGKSTYHLDNIVSATP